MKVNIITLGCSKNTADSEHVAGQLTKAGIQVYFDRQKTDCDIIIVNTCGFIGDAKEESINTILEQVNIKSRGRRKRYLIAVGCLIERYQKELKKEIPEIDAFYGVHHWNQMCQDILKMYHKSLDLKTSCHIKDFESEHQQSTPKHYAYLKIAEGCNRRCSYCAIPLIRGKHVSRPIEDIIQEAQKMVRQGVKELIVIAQDTTYYGVDLYGERRLGELLERLALESEAQWIRLHYTYPTSFPTDAINVMKKYKNICNYIDIPLQHINTRILQSMQRGIDREGTIALLKQFREAMPDVAIRTTFIAGYPGETEEEFQELLQFVKDARFDRMGVFPYSPEEGTLAETLGDDIPMDTKLDRVSQLMAIQEKISLENNEKKVGNTYTVIIDRLEGDYYIGRTEYDSPEVDDEVLILKTKGLNLGQFYQIRITQALENDLYGELV